MHKLVIALVGLAIVVASLLYWDQYADADALAADALYNSACIYDGVTNGASALDNTKRAASQSSQTAAVPSDCATCPRAEQSACGASGGCGGGCQHSS